MLTKVRVATKIMDLLTAMAMVATATKPTELVMTAAATMAMVATQTTEMATAMAMVAIATKTTELVMTAAATTVPLEVDTATGAATIDSRLGAGKGFQLATWRGYFRYVATVDVFG